MLVTTTWKAQEPVSTELRFYLARLALAAVRSQVESPQLRDSCRLEVLSLSTADPEHRSNHHPGN